jgi:hypothetical protein
MARNILQNVVSGYLARDPAILRTVEALKLSALATKEAHDAQDIDGFRGWRGALLGLKKSIDPARPMRRSKRASRLGLARDAGALLPAAGGVRLSSS